MPPKKSKSKSNSRATSPTPNGNNNTSATTGSGKEQWESMIEQLGQATQNSFNADNDTSTKAPFDPKAYIEQQQQSGGRNEFTDQISASSKLQQFLAEKKDDYEKDVLGKNNGNVAFPLYVPRVNMIEATHSMPAEPTATDAFRFHQMPEKIEQLPHSGPNWEGICGNAMEAATFRLKLKQVQQLQQQQNNSNNNNSSNNNNNNQLQRRLTKLTQPGKAVDFIPIILVPGGASSIVQISNVKDLLENGYYRNPHEQWMDKSSGATQLARHVDDEVYVSPTKMFGSEPLVKFRQFKVLDDPSKVDNWDHVCGCFVAGGLWQFEGWYGGSDPEKCQPRNIFDVNVKAFLPFFEDEKVPHVLKEWKVTGLQLSRRTSKAHMSISVARLFWEKLFDFMEIHPFFRQYTVEAPTRLR